MHVRDSIYFPIKDSRHVTAYLRLDVVFVFIVVLPVFTWTQTGEPYLEIKILDCDILQFQVKNSPHNFEINEIHIYEQIDSEKNMIFYSNLKSNKIKNHPSRLGLFIKTLNSSNVKLKSHKSSVDTYPVLIHVFSSSENSYQTITCLKYNANTTCYNTGYECTPNKITYVSFTPENPIKNYPFCIKVHYGIQRHYYIDRLIFQAQDVNQELRTDIYTFKRSSSFDVGQGTFDEISAWAQRINKSSNLSNDTVCLLDVLPEDINVTFYWNIRIRSRINNNKIKCMYSFKVPEMITDKVERLNPKDYDYSNNKITNVTFSPKYPMKNHPFCIQVHYTIQSPYYIDKLIFQTQNANEEIKIDIHTFSKSSFTDPGHVTLDDKSYWSSRIDKSSNLSNDTVCFIKLLSSDNEVTFYWNLLLKNRINKHKIKCIFKFQLPIFIEVKTGPAKPMDHKGSGSRTFLTASMFGGILLLSIAVGKVVYH